MTTLETRRLRGDMIELYKILTNLDVINYENMLVLDAKRLRGHSLKLYKKRFRSDIGKFSFGNRVVDEWNRLPEEVISSQNVNVFKNRLDKYFRIGRGLI